MTRTRRCEVVAITLLAGLLGLALSSIAAAQEQPSTKKQGGNQLEAGPEANPPAADAGRPAHRAPKTKRRSTKKLPKPTVVLKPGEVPAIKFDTLEHDFGRIMAGSELIHEYRFINTGTGPLEILKVKAGCGCTVVGQHDRIVPPGATGRIPISVHSKKSNGKVNKSIVVHTNIAGPDATVRLRVQAEVWHPVEVSPSLASFGRLSKEQIQRGALRRLIMVNNMEGMAQPAIVESTNDLFAAELKVLEPGKKFELLVRITPPLEPGRHSGTIEISTGIAETPNLRVPVHVNVPAEVEVIPQKLRLPSKLGSGVTRSIQIRNNSCTPLKISDLAVSSAALTTRLEVIKPGMVYSLEVNIPSDYEATSGGDKITFKTNCPSAPEITIPISKAPVVRRASLPKEPPGGGLTKVTAGTATGQQR